MLLLTFYCAAPTQLLLVLYKWGAKKVGSKLFENAIRALEILERAGHSAKLAGGCVRDRLLGLEPKDYDIATTATPAQIIDTFTKQKMKTIPTGIEHGTITLAIGHQPIEITTLRRDVATDGRRATVAFGTNFREDAERRDFTINAMFEDREGRIDDYFLGQEHIKARQLVFVGEPTQRIREDYLRILRLYRFWTRFHFTPQKQALEAVAKERGGLEKVSQERITNELLQIFGAEKNREALESLNKTGIWGQLFGGTSLDAILLDQCAAFDSIPDTSLRALARFAQFLNISSYLPAQEFGKRLRLSVQQTRTIDFFAKLALNFLQIKLTPADILELYDEAASALATEPFENSFQAWLKAIAQDAKQKTHVQSIVDLYRKHADRRTAKLPLSGHDLVQELKIKEGQELGALLAALKREFRNGTWTTREEGIKRAHLYISSKNTKI